MVRQEKSLHGYSCEEGDVYRECLRDAEQGDLTSTLANMDALPPAQFEQLVKAAERNLCGTVRK